jgi:hypothetical protein
MLVSMKFPPHKVMFCSNYSFPWKDERFGGSATWIIKDDKDKPKQLADNEA